jgi:uracil-DNA glycosylase
MRALFIGQAPSKETDGLEPFVGRSGKFLAALMGLTHEEMLEQHDFINILNAWPGAGSGGDLFPIDEAKRKACELLPSLNGRLVVFLGSNVARAFELNKFSFFEFYQLLALSQGSTTVASAAVVPHPSGINRWYNDHNNRETASRFLLSLQKRCKEMPSFIRKEKLVVDQSDVESMKVRLEKLESIVKELYSIPVDMAQPCGSANYKVIFSRDNFHKLREALKRLREDP